MKRFIVFNNEGIPLYTATPSDPNSFGELSAGSGIILEVPEYLDLKSDDWLIDRTYLIEGVLKEKNTKPGEYYEWNAASESWLPNLDAAKAAKKAEIETELSHRLYLPCNGFDADNVSRERISGMIARLQRGDGLPAGWLGWRDANNNMHWAEDDAATMLANLTALSRAIEDREQALLVASWAHKASIAALEDIDAIITYPVTEGWPT